MYGNMAPETTVVLITQDHDFLPMLSKLRNQRDIHVVLITNFRNSRTSFLNAANESFEWNEIVADADRMGGSKEVQRQSSHDSQGSHHSQYSQHSQHSNQGNNRGAKAPISKTPTMPPKAQHGSTSSERSAKSLKKHYVLPQNLHLKKA